MVQRLKSRNEQGMRRVNYIAETEDVESDVEEEQLVLKIEGKGSKPFYMEGLMCGNHFKAIIDTGSPVSILGIHPGIHPRSRTYTKSWASGK